MLIKTCVCGGEDFEVEERHELPVRRCLACGVRHQVVSTAPEDLLTWYATDYHQSVYTHKYTQDALAAKRRMQVYAPFVQDKLLDIGCGNKAFVETARQHHIPAYGLDLHIEPEGPYYKGELAEQNFPCSYFQTVTMHDVLEHVVDPVGMLKEVARITEPNGFVFLDFPDFWVTAGRKHWKSIEHVWFFRLDEVEKLARKVGLVLEEMTTPVAGKKTFRFKKLPVERPRILVPPGIGDSFWAITKIESLIEREHFAMRPEVQIASTDPAKDRAFEFVRRFPFLECTGYFNSGGPRFKRNPIWREAYHEDGDGVFLNVLGFNWFLSANGPFRFDKTLDEIMPQYETNWYPKMFISAEERDIAREEAKDPYIVVFFTSSGPYKKWFDGYTPEMIIDDLHLLMRKGYRVLLTGAAWDASDDLVSVVADGCANRTKFEDLRGQTSIDAFLGLLRGASGTLGHCGGNTIFSTVLKKPTVILWNDYYNRKFFTASCPPDSLDRWYKPINTKHAKKFNPAKQLLELMND